MHHFHYQNGILHVEDVDLLALAAEVGSPAYVYSTATLQRHVKVFREAFAPREIDIFYAMKANGNLSVIRAIAQAGTGVDVVSEGEIRKAMAAGVAAERIVFSGVGKTDDELRYAVAVGLHQINVETPGELQRLANIAKGMGKSARVALRVNPSVGAGGHAKITTGHEANKFGISLGEAVRLYSEGAGQKHLEMRGLAVHIGSQIFDLAEPKIAFSRIADLVREVRLAGHNLTHVDLGGGLGVHYDSAEAGEEGSERIQAYAAMVEDVFGRLDVRLGFEPGRLIVANAGLLIAQVVGFNQRSDRTFLVVDAGMNDLVRPAMYDARHDIWPLRQAKSDQPHLVYDVVGPICESSDQFAQSVRLPRLEVGAFLAFMSAGAYGASMSSTYNLRPLVPEVLVAGTRHAVVRPRQSYDELIALDRIAPWLTEG